MAMTSEQIMHAVAQACGLEIVDADEMSKREARKLWICRYSTDGYHFSEYTGETPEAAIEECRRVRTMWGWEFKREKAHTYQKGTQHNIDLRLYFDPAEKLEKSELLITGGH